MPKNLWSGDRLMENFFEMLTYKRPMGTDTEEAFISRFLAPLGVERDEVGNIWKRIGESDVLWSSHTDTVHHSEGMQELKITDKRVSLADDEKSNCLGADCGTGVFIMTEMIKANKPGLYVFHRGEERGAHGSRHIAKDKTLLEGINKAIAFDRYGTTSVITHQGSRCCSDKFADSIIDQFDFMSKDNTGLFTDTANYDHIVAECTNLSVGYKHHHSNSEYQDLEYLAFFIKKMIELDADKLIVARDPNEVDNSHFSYGGWNGVDSEGYDFHPWNSHYTAEDKMFTLVKANPKATASLLKLYGITAEELLEHCFEYSGRV